MMFFLADFSVIQPDIGLIFWTSILFLILWFILGRVGFKPIQKALKERENSIEDALKQAEKARQEMAKLNAENEKILAQAREERSKILKEAKALSNNMIADAKDKAKVEANKIISNAKIEIENQKRAAITELKNRAGIMALDIAEKVIKERLHGNRQQEAFVQKLVNEIELN